MVRDMTHPNPPDRPSVGSIITRFTRLRSNLRPNQLKRALSPKASSDPLRDHLRSLGISRDPLEPDPGFDPIEDEDSDDPTLGIRTTSSGETHDSAGSAAGEDYWDSEATRRSVSTAATSLTTSPTATSPPPVPGIGSVFSQWLPGRPKSPVTLKKGPPTPIVVPQNPISPASQADLLGGRRGPLPFFARSLSPDSVPPSPNSPTSTSPINIHHHRKGSSGGPSGTLAFLKTGKFPWTVSESPSSRASTPDIEKFKLESEFMAYAAANGGAGNNSVSPSSPGNSWSKAMNGLHGFMGGKRRGRERSNSKLSISSDTVPWGSAGAAASASALDMANWGSNPEDVAVPNPTPPSGGGLAAFWGLSKSSSSPPVKKEKKSKSTSMAPPPNAAGWDIPKPEASSSMSTPLLPAVNGTPAELVKEVKPSSKSSTAKPTPASTPPSAAPPPITKLSKKANKKAAQSAPVSAPVPTPITEEDLPPRTTEEEEWTPGSSSISPPKGVSSFWSAGKEEKKKKKAEKAETQALFPPTMPVSASQPSLVSAMAETWNEEPAPDMSHWAGTEHGFGFAHGPGPAMPSTFNTTTWSPPLSVPGLERESPRTAASPISFSQRGSASSSSKATPTTSGKSTPAPATPLGKADKRTPVSTQGPALAKPLATAEENPDAADWMAFTNNKMKAAGLRPSKLGSSVISADPEEKPDTPSAGKPGTTPGWAAKQRPPKQESSAWGAFGASPTDADFHHARAKAKAPAPGPTKKSAQVGGAPPIGAGGWGSINTPLQPPIENNWDTWSARSVPAIEIVGAPTASPTPTSPPMSTWKPPGSTPGGNNNSRTSTVNGLDFPSATHTARSSWTSLVKEPHGFNAAQLKFNGSGSTLGPVSEGLGESGAVNEVWDMDMGGNGPASDVSLPWPGELSPELLRSLQGPTEYSSASGSDKESRKRKSEIGSGLRRPESGFKSAFANLSDSGEENGKPSLVPNRNPLNNVSDSSSRSSWSAFPKKATSSPPGFGLSKSPLAPPAVITSTAKGKTATVKPTSMPGGFLSWDEDDGEPKDVDLDQLIAMAGEPKDSTEPVSNFPPKNQTAAPPKAPAASMPAPTPVARGKKGKKTKARANNGFDEEEPEPEAPPIPVSSAVDDDLLAQLDRGLRPREVKPPPSPYKTRTKTVWIEDEVPTRTGSLEASSFPNPLEEKEKFEKAKKVEEEKDEEKEKEETKVGAGGGAKKGNNNNKKGKKKR